jgi:hypothetical protein
VFPQQAAPTIGRATPGLVCEWLRHFFAKSALRVTPPIWVLCAYGDSMNWEALGALAEMIGAIAVISTLIFLALQVKHGSRSIDRQNALAESDSVTRSVDLIDQWRLTLVSNRDIAELWSKGLRQEELDEVDLLRFRELVMLRCQIMHAIYFQNLKAGRLDAAENIVQAQADMISEQPAIGDAWKRNPNIFDPTGTGLKEKIELALKAP